MKTKTEKTFDTVNFFRDIKAKLDAEKEEIERKKAEAENADMENSNGDLPF